MAHLCAGWRPYVLLTLLCAVLFLPGLTELPATDRDEARFAQASKQMLQSGNYVVPHFQERRRTKKPAGIYWLQAGSTAALSSADAREIWSYRVPSVFGAWAAVLLTFALGRRLFGPESGLIGAGLLASSLLLVAEAHLAKTDAVLLATGLLAFSGLAALWMASRAGAPPPRHAWIAVWAGLGLAALIKGPIIPAVFALSLLGLRGFGGDWRWLAGLYPGRGLVLGVAILSPWLVALWLGDAFSFVADSAKEDLIPKLLSGVESHGAPPGTYLASVYAAFWPGALLVVPAFVAAWWRRRDPGVAFCLAWIVPAWILFEAVPTKLPHYPLPMYPALALLAGAAVAQRWPLPRTRWARGLLGLHLGLWGLVAFGLLAAVVVAPARMSETGVGAWSLGLAALLTAGLGLALWAIRRTSPRGAAAAAVATMLLFVPWLGEVYAPRLDRLWVAREVSERIPPPAARPPLAAAGYHEPSLVFRAGTRTMLTGADGVARHLARQPGAYALVGEREHDRVRQRLQDRDVDLATVARFRGFNYSKGDPLRLTILRSRPGGSSSDR